MASTDANAPASAILGDGYGSDHCWTLVRTAQVGAQIWLKNTAFVCHDCGAYFEHYYDALPDIHEAMRLSDIDNRCPWKGDRDSLDAAKDRADAAAAQVMEALQRQGRAIADAELAAKRMQQARIEVLAAQNKVLAARNEILADQDKILADQKSIIDKIKKVCEGPPRG